MHAAYAQHVGTVRAAVSLYGLPSDLADEVTLETFVMAHGRGEDLRTPAIAKARLCVLALRVTDSFRDEVPAGAPPVSYGVPGGTVLSVFLEGLRDRRRDMFVLAELGGLRVPEISAELGLGFDSVRSAMVDLLRDFAVTTANAEAEEVLHLWVEACTPEPGALERGWQRVLRRVAPDLVVPRMPTPSPASWPKPAGFEPSPPAQPAQIPAPAPGSLLASISADTAEPPSPAFQPLMSARPSAPPVPPASQRAAPPPVAGPPALGGRGPDAPVPSAIPGLPALGGPPQSPFVQPLAPPPPAIGGPFAPPQQPLAPPPPAVGGPFAPPQQPLGPPPPAVGPPFAPPQQPLAPPPPAVGPPQPFAQPQQPLAPPPPAVGPPQPFAAPASPFAAPPASPFAPPQPFAPQQPPGPPASPFAPPQPFAQQRPPGPPASPFAPLQQQPFAPQPPGPPQQPFAPQQPPGPFAGPPQQQQFAGPPQQPFAPQQPPGSFAGPPQQQFAGPPQQQFAGPPQPFAQQPPGPPPPPQARPYPPVPKRTGSFTDESLGLGAAAPQRDTFNDPTMGTAAAPARGAHTFTSEGLREFDSRPDHRRQRSSPLVWVVPLLLLLGGGAAAGWWFFLRTPEDPEEVVADASDVPADASVAPVDSLPVEPTPVDTTPPALPVPVDTTPPVEPTPPTPVEPTPIPTPTKTPDVKPKPNPTTPAKPKPKPSGGSGGGGGTKSDDPFEKRRDEADKADPGRVIMELEMLSAAKNALKSNPLQSIAYVDQHNKEFPSSQLTDQFDEVKIKALCGLGRSAQAKTEAANILKKRPNSRVAAAVKLCK